eukprot:TRINITY_DN14714_c0_g1_i1.p1 TRINITY_DN14714_c0_g1~~TRINITY_DN14714_c0_g1_i1.p1  ORF type:complete len:352 (-),score=57.39 TRINITY_DN14714_c0_g1_i1:35-1090(-)
MFVPTNVDLCLSFILIAMVLWGSWANSMKFAKVRYELFYYDYALGLFAFALIAALTMGGRMVSPDPDVDFPGCLSTVSNEKVAFAMAAGLVFNVANFLLITSIELVGMSIAFPAGIGISMLVGTSVNYLLSPTAKPGFLFSGLVLAFIAVIFNSLAFKFRKAEEKPSTPHPDADDESLVKENPKTNKSKLSLLSSILLCVLCGFLMGTWSPLSSQAMSSPGGLSAYTTFFFFTLTILITTFPLCYYFSKKPIIGLPFLPLTEYCLGGLAWHAIAFAGGVAWSAGTLLFLVGSTVIGPASSYAIGQSAPLIAALWGLFYWKEFSNPNGIVITCLVMTFLSYGGAIALITLSI